MYLYIILWVRCWTLCNEETLESRTVFSIFNLKWLLILSILRGISLRQKVYKTFQRNTFFSGFLKEFYWKQMEFLSKVYKVFGSEMSIIKNLILKLRICMNSLIFRLISTAPISPPIPVFQQWSNLLQHCVIGQSHVVRVQCHTRGLLCYSLKSKFAKGFLDIPTASELSCPN